MFEVFKGYERPDGAGVVSVLRGVRFSAQRGEKIAVVGPSGSGKSTFLHILGCLESADSGRVLISGRDIQGLSNNELAALRNREIGFVFQLHHLLPQCTVLENVLVPTLPLSAKKQTHAAEHARILLQHVGLADRQDHKPSQLSGGERLRAAVARALVNQPRLLVADEPTGSLDAENSAQITALLQKTSEDENVTLVVVTHSTELARRMDRVLHLRNGVLAE